jgi:hypothetical protein
MTLYGEVGSELMENHCKLPFFNVLGDFSGENFDFENF